MGKSLGVHFASAEHRLTSQIALPTAMESIRFVEERQRELAQNGLFLSQLTGLFSGEKSALFLAQFLVLRSQIQGNRSRRGGI